MVAKPTIPIRKGDDQAQPDNRLAVDLDEAALRLGVSAKTVKRMADAGELPGVFKIRRRTLVSVAALTSFVDRLAGGKAGRR